jgi:hypothetical protein
VGETVVVVQVADLGPARHQPLVPFGEVPRAHDLGVERDIGSLVHISSSIDARYRREPAGI